MKIKEATYSNKYVTGPYLNHQPGLVADLEEGEDPVEALIKLKAICDAFDKRVNNFEDRLVVPSIQPERMDEPQEIQLERPSDVKTALIQDIMSCNEVKVLESYKLLVKSQPELQAAYDKRMEELTQNLKR